jgi:hypothetical protein
MLSNHDIDKLRNKMNILNFKGCFYKDKLKKYNRIQVISLI